MHPFPSSHWAVVVHSMQPATGVPVHTPFTHKSPFVHACPSSQSKLLFVWKQPLAGLQPSVVHSLPSPQFTGGPPTHEPTEQVSLVVQAFPSSQGNVLFVWKQPLAGLHESLVQTFPSLQLSGTPLTQNPPEQVSFVVQALPSSQESLLLA